MVAARAVGFVIGNQVRRLLLYMGGVKKGACSMRHVRAEIEGGWIESERVARVQTLDGVEDVVGSPPL